MSHTNVISALKNTQEPCRFIYRSKLVKVYKLPSLINPDKGRSRTAKDSFFYEIILDPTPFGIHSAFDHR